MSEHLHRIKKLLAVAKGQANEEESATAMRLAAELMIKHGITQDDLKEKPTGRVKYGKVWVAVGDKPWLNALVRAAGILCGSKPLWDRAHHVSFVGRPENNAAADELFAWLHEQVESLYKEHLPSCLSKKDRAQFRSDFKYACARRVESRAWKIMQDIQSSGVEGCTALVVVHHTETLNKEIEEFFTSIGVKPTSTQERKKVQDREGTYSGYVAAERVKLRKEIEE